MTLRSLVVITALGCSGPAASPSTAPADPKPVPVLTQEPEVTTAAPPPATAPVPEPLPPMTDEEMKAMEAGQVKGAPSAQLVLATKLNQQGAELMTARRYEEASRKFREAYTRVPHSSYLFNLCRSLYQQGKLAEARNVCRMVIAEVPGADLEGKATAMVTRIEAEARAQNVVLP